MRIANYRQRGRITSANRGSQQSQGLVGWLPFNSPFPYEPLTRSAISVTGNATIAAPGVGRFPGLYGPNSGSFTGATIAPVPATFKLNKPVTLVWIGYVFSNGNISSYPRLIGVQYNDADGAPFSAYEIGRPNGDVNKLFVTTNSNGSQVYTDVNISLASRYGQLLVCVATFTTSAVKLWVNGTLVNTSTGIAGTILYGSNPPLVINRANTTAAGTCDSLTLDARIYNRELSEREITDLYPNGWQDLYYNFAHEYNFASGGDFFSMMTGF